MVSHVQQFLTLSPCQFNIRAGWLLTCLPEQPCLLGGFWERRALWAVPKPATARHAKCSCCCKALAGILPPILCTTFLKKYGPEVFCGLCRQVERNTEVWKKYLIMITLCSEDNMWKTAKNDATQATYPCSWIFAPFVNWVNFFNPSALKWKSFQSLVDRAKKKSLIVITARLIHAWHEK